MSETKVETMADRLLAALHKIAYEPLGVPECSHAEVLEEVVKIARAAIDEAEAAGPPLLDAVYPRARIDP